MILKQMAFTPIRFDYKECNSCGFPTRRRLMEKGRYKPMHWSCWKASDQVASQLRFIKEAFKENL